ncbi:MAG: MFS transporter [Chloroflexota bacterium]
MSNRLTEISMLRALRTPSFALLWGGQSCSRLGDYLYEIGLAWWVLEKTGEAGAMATVLIFAFGPTALFSLFGGVAVDRYSRLWIMLIADLVRGATALVMGVLAISGLLEIWHVYILSLVFGIVEAFFHPAYTATVPELVSMDDLPSANSLTSLSIQGGRILGPPLGALMIALGGTASIFLWNGLTFFVAALLLLPLLQNQSIQSIHALRSSPQDNTPGLLDDFREGMRIVLGLPWLWLSILVFALSNATLGGPYSVSLPFLVDEVLGGKVQLLGLLYALFAGGYVLGGIAMGQMKRIPHRGRLMYGGLAIAGLMILLFGLPIGLVGLALAALVNGAMLEVGGLAWTHSLQELVPRDKLGRIASIDNLGSLAFVPIGYGIAGWATELFGPQQVFLVGGGLTVLFALMAWSHPAVRQLN